LRHFANGVKMSRIQMLKTMPDSRISKMCSKAEGTSSLYKTFLCHNPLSSKISQVSYFWHSTRFHNTFYKSNTLSSPWYYAWLLSKTILHYPGMIFAFFYEC
jgi:hypothetical protein